MALGLYERFPADKIHRLETFSSTLSTKQLQRKLIQVLYEINRKEFSFEELTNPTVPEGKVIFEFGLADGADFNYIDEEELKMVLDFLEKQRLSSMDFFCALRYYKGGGEKKSALKFDYYMLRASFSKDALELQAFHERGPRYISPQELVAIIAEKVNACGPRKTLKKIQL